jgi:hypothetical protein
MSFWANTGRIDVELADGTPESYFIKVISKETGRNMMHSEFESMKAIHAIVPDFVPRPIAWGTYQSIPDTRMSSPGPGPSEWQPVSKLYWLTMVIRLLPMRVPGL